MAREESFDVALLDVNLASEQSFPVAHVLRERGIPFIFATGYGSKGLDERFRDEITLQKPFEMRQLEQAIFSALAPARAMEVGEAGMILEICRRDRSNSRAASAALRSDLPRLSARSHLLGLIAAAVVPVWLFAAYILAQYALNERARFEREAAAGGAAGIAGGRRRADDPDDRAAGPVQILRLRRRRPRGAAGGGRQAGRGQRPHHPAARSRAPPAHQHASALWRRAAARRAAVGARSRQDQGRPACRRRRLCQPAFGRIPDRRGASRARVHATRTGFSPSPFPRPTSRT